MGHKEMAEAVAEKTKIKDDEFDIHGDLAVSESDDKSFVVLYDSSVENPQLTPANETAHEATMAHTPAETIPAPTLEDIDETHGMTPAPAVHPEDAYIDDILSSDDIETNEAPEMVSAPHAPLHTEAAHEDDDGPIALSSEELDGILEMGPETEEEFHPDFPVEHQAEKAPEPEPVVAPVETDQTFDDDELPIALSDEDLDEILLEEEGNPPTVPVAKAAPAAAPAVSEQPMAPPPLQDDDDEEPIALSDDELDNILADAEAGHSDAAPPELTQSDEDEVLTLDEAPEITMIDDGANEFENRESGSTSADAGSFFDSDEDEPITLSDEELDGILSTAPEEDAPQHTDEVALESADAGTPALEVEDDEPIALSNEELDGILMDAEEAPFDTPAATQGEPASAADANAGFFDSDEDEPIALSADELDGIAATAETEDAPLTPPTLADLPPEDHAPAEAALMDERYADVDHMDASAPLGTGSENEEDGPIALSSDELDGIVADSREVTPEAPMMPLSPLDTGRDEPSLAENADKPATVFEEDLEAATLIHEDETAAAAAAPPPETEELKSVMSYLDNLLGELPDDVIEKFAQSEYFKMYQKIMDKLGL